MWRQAPSKTQFCKVDKCNPNAIDIAKTDSLLNWLNTPKIKAEKRIARFFGPTEGITSFALVTKSVRFR